MLGDDVFQDSFKAQVVRGIGAKLHKGQGVKWKNMRLYEGSGKNRDDSHNRYIHLEVRGGDGSVDYRLQQLDNGGFASTPEIAITTRDKHQYVFSCNSDGHWVHPSTGAINTRTLVNQFTAQMATFGKFFQEIAEPLEIAVPREGFLGIIGVTKKEKNC